MVQKTYLKYVSSHKGGAVVSSLCQQMACAELWKGGPPIAVVAALEDVALWNMRSGDLHRLLPIAAAAPSGMRPCAEITSILLAREGEAQWALAVGLSNGHVAFFRSSRGARNWECQFEALGHKYNTSVLCIALNEDCTTMVTGGQDTDVTVWDATAEDPLYRLRGHRGAVVGVSLISSSGGPNVALKAVSGSADGLVKVWSLAAQQCIQTIVASDTQVTSIATDIGRCRLFVGLRDNMLKVFDLTPLSQNGEVAPHGTLPRKSSKPVTSIVFRNDGKYLALCHPKGVELFGVLSSEEVQQKVQRKRRRKAKRAEEEDGGDDGGAKAAVEGEAAIEEAVDGKVEPQGGAQAQEGIVTASEEFTFLREYHFENPVRSVSFLPCSNRKAEEDTVEFVVCHSNNTVASYSAKRTVDESTGAHRATLSEYKSLRSVDHVAHTSDIRRVAFSSDDALVVTMSENNVKMWGIRYQSAVAMANMEADDGSMKCPRRMPTAMSCTGSVLLPASDPATCCLMLPGDEIVAVGSSTGKLLLLSLTSAETIFTAPAHNGAISDFTTKADQSGLMSIGADRRLVEWEYVMTEANVLNLVQKREAELDDVPLSVRSSEDGKLVAVALQNSSVALIFADTLKPFLLLYGHKLPAAAIDFSSDGTICATGGMDKSLRFWGTDFGDCHRAIHAHDDYITGLQFVRNTHYVFTVSRDGTVKHWDADASLLVQAFRIHQRGLWAVAINSDGTCVATAGSDRMLRTFMRTDEMLFPQEEEERMAQEAMDHAAAQRAALNRLEDADAEAGVSGEKTPVSMTLAEQLMEALDAVSIERQRLANAHDSSAPSPLFRNTRPEDYLWSQIETVRPSEMRHVLSSLTSVHISALLEMLGVMSDAGSIRNYELAARVLLACSRPAPGANAQNFLSLPLLTSTAAASPGAGSQKQEVESSVTRALQTLLAVRNKISAGLQRDLRRMSYCGAGLSFLQKAVEQAKKIKFFDRTKVQGAKRRFAKRQTKSS